VRRSTGRTLGSLWAPILLALFAVGAPVAQAADEDHQGLQGGWAVDDRGNIRFFSAFALHNPVMHEAEAGWVRLNFRLGACFPDWTSVGCNGRTALESYDEVVDIALTSRFRVLGLITNEAWPGTQEEWTANNAEHDRGNGDNPYMRRFADEAVETLATHFKHKIGQWEIWNEPNAWRARDERGRPIGGSFIYPSNFAWALTRSYEAIKRARPGAVVISGGLFGHDLPGPALLFARRACPTAVGSGADYLCATYEMGLAQAGWRPGAFPFDHVGQHLYVDQGEPTSEEKLRLYLDDLRDAYRWYEGPATPKLTHITEFGWSTLTLSPELQAGNLLTAFDTFRQAGYVARSYWFHAQDVPEADLYYGLADESGRKKRSFTVYQDAAAYDGPEPANERTTTEPPSERIAQPIERPTDDPNPVMVVGGGT
jgi:hypothetical protein